MSNHPKRRLRAPVRAALYTASLAALFAAGAFVFPFALSSGQPRLKALAYAAESLSGHSLSNNDQTLALALPIELDHTAKQTDSPSSSNSSSVSAGSWAAVSSAQSAGSEDQSDASGDGSSQSESESGSDLPDPSASTADLTDAKDGDILDHENESFRISADCGFAIQTDASTVKTILIDPGHGGDDLGDGGKDGTMEKIVALSFAKMLKEHLNVQNPALNVILLREDDSRPGTTAWNDSLARLKAQQDCNADYVISLHAHALDDPAMRGYQIILDQNDPITALLATKIQSNLSSVSFSENRGLLDTSDYPLQTISMSDAHAIELDLLSLSNAQDLALTKDEAALNQAAAAVAAAISDTVLENPDA